MAGSRSTAPLNRRKSVVFTDLNLSSKGASRLAAARPRVPSPGIAAKLLRESGTLLIRVYRRSAPSAANNLFPRRRSSVSGNCGFSSRDGVAIGPVVELNARKRAPRRHSASFALTGNVS